MQIGTFDTTFTANTLEARIDGVRAAGLGNAQFDFLSAGLPSSLPTKVDEVLNSRVRQAYTAREITMTSVSGTFNMINPDIDQRRKDLLNFDNLAASAAQLGAPFISLCTGTRNADSMWRPHTENNSPEAWQDLLESMVQAVQVAEEHGRTLVIEPEVANVVDSAQKARRLLDEIASPHLKVVFDGANIFHKGELPRMHELLDEAFNLLGDDIVLAHAKDLDRDGEAGHLAAGTGLLDYDHYVGLYRKIGFRGTILLHGLKEEQVDGCVAFLQAKLEASRS